MSASQAADPPESWSAALEESDAELARGDLVPLAVIQDEVRATIHHIEARLADLSTDVFSQR